MTTHVTFGDLAAYLRNMAEAVRHKFPGQWVDVYPVPRGGVPVALGLRAYLDNMNIVDNPATADIIVDDIIDSGATARRLTLGTARPFMVLIAKNQTGMPNVWSAAIHEPTDWVVFPWEGNEQGSAEDVPVRLLQYIGEDPTRGGLLETPARFLKAWREWTKGYKEKPEDVLKSFADGAEKYDEMVLVGNIPVHSKCEHHLADIFGLAHVGYIPNGRIVGLSKLARLVDVYARRLQVQERLTSQVADALETHLEPKGVGVILQCRHACMESRGVHVQGAVTTTSAMRGALLNKPEARAEFLRLVDSARNGVPI